MSEHTKYPKFVTSKWLADSLRIDDAEAVAVAKKIANIEEGWDHVENKLSFAEAFLEMHMVDPSVGELCRRAIGPKAPTLFKFPEDDEAPKVSDTAPASKLVGYFAECARIAAERGDHEAAIERAVVEMLEFGEKATDAFEFAVEVQASDKYAEFVETAKEVDSRARALNLVDEGLYPVEANGEADAGVARDYSLGKLSITAEKALLAKDKVAALQEVAAELANAARATAAHMQISTAPLATLSAIANLTESVGIIQQQQKGAEDEDLDKGAKEAHDAVDACEDVLVDRKQACESRLKAEEVAEVAKKAANQVKKAAAMPVKNMADMKKMQEVFVKANQAALEACKLVRESATFISKLKEVKPNDEAADALFAQIEEAFRGARTDATRDVAERAKQASEAQAQAKELSDQLRESVAKDKEKEEVAVESGPELSKGEAREKLLGAFAEFASKRWDTDLATQTLRRLTDRRKEVIGQVWEAVETDASDADRLVEKFTEQFSSTMDARRRLDAVVRLMGRGSGLDARKSKWFIENIMKLSEAASAYQKSL